MTTGRINQVTLLACFGSLECFRTQETESRLISAMQHCNHWSLMKGLVQLLSHKVNSIIPLWLETIRRATTNLQAQILCDGNNSKLVQIRLPDGKSVARSGHICRLQTTTTQGEYLWTAALRSTHQTIGNRKQFLASFPNIPSKIFSFSANPRILEIECTGGP